MMFPSRSGLPAMLLTAGLLSQSALAFRPPPIRQSLTGTTTTTRDCKTAATNETIPSLASIRTTLDLYETAIIHTALSRSVFNVSAALAEEEKTFVTQLIQTAATADAASDWTSVAGTVPDALFEADGGKLLPYLLYTRNASVGARWGSVDAGDEVSVWTYAFDTLFPPVANSSSSADLLPTDPLTHTLPRASLTSSLLSLLSTRMSMGKAVGLAKLYDASTASIDSSVATPNATFCAMLKSGDTKGVRAALTVKTQEASVLASVTAKTQRWVNGTGADVAAAWVPKMVGLFEILINVTTDVEVATLLARQAQNATGC